MILDNVISLIAPFECLECSQKGYLLCPACELTTLEKVLSKCYRCHRSTSQFNVCQKCRKSVVLKRLFISTNYESLAKDLLEQVKFERAKMATKDIARIISETLPILPQNTLVTFVPTAPNRVRIRGYDQSRLIAKHLSRIIDLEFIPIFDRLNNSRQLGSDRKTRFSQAEQAYKVKSKVSIKGKNILIVDDVTTSGATLETLAKMLKKSGTKEVNCAVFAQAVS